MKTQNNKMKKRIGIISIMLVLLLAIGATAGITMAKYISSANNTSQIATAAKWGYTLTADARGLFGTKYGNVTGNFATASENGVVVSSASGNVIAPGTKGSATILSINGSAEVNAVLTIDVSEFKNLHLVGGGYDYYPIKWTVNNTQAGKEISSSTFVAEIVKALKNALPNGITVSSAENVITVELPAGTSFTNGGFALNIAWEWALETAKDGGGNYNVEDTILGQIANANGATGALSAYSASVWQVSLGLSARVEQVQEFPSKRS